MYKRMHVIHVGYNAFEFKFKADGMQNNGMKLEIRANLEIYEISL